MTKFKTYGQFINESNKDNIVNVILDSLEPTIVEMLAATEKWFVETFKQEFTKYDREMSRINLTYDMVKSIEMYTLPTDQLLSMNVRKSVKGNIQIDAQIQRGENTYSFQTEAIYAGGHNIQRLHYRYIVKTSIPKTGATEIAKEYADKIKKMSKLEKLNNEISNYEARIERVEAKIEANSKLNDEEILNVLKSEKDWYQWPSWSEIVKRGANVNYDNDENVFNQKQKEHIEHKIGFWKNMNVDSQKNYLKMYNKELQKLIAKRDSMV